MFRANLPDSWAANRLLLSLFRCWSSSRGGSSSSFARTHTDRQLAATHTLCWSPSFPGNDPKTGEEGKERSSKFGHQQKKGSSRDFPVVVFTTNCTHTHGGAFAGQILPGNWSFRGISGESSP
uniref:(northern house mosquito) hypothetical protein n=1 Tax=Culex pipiens TaxID=7175 RepID=A0A8D8DS63_CULPI